MDLAIIIYKGIEMIILRNTFSAYFLAFFAMFNLFHTSLLSMQSNDSDMQDRRTTMNCIQGQKNQEVSRVGIRQFCQYLVQTGILPRELATLIFLFDKKITWVDPIACSCNTPDDLLRAAGKLLEDCGQNLAIEVMKMGLQKAESSLLKIKDTRQWTTLHHAVAQNKVDVIKLILEVDHPNNWNLMRQKTETGDTALYLGIWHRFGEVLKVLNEAFPNEKCYELLDSANNKIMCICMLDHFLES